jgi:hypothetical protein
MKDIRPASRLLWSSMQTGKEILTSLTRSASSAEHRENVVRLKRCFLVGLVMWPCYTPLDFMAAQQGASLPALLAIRVSVPLALGILLLALRTRPAPAAVVAIEIIAFSIAATGLGLHAFIGQGFRTATFTSTFTILVIQGLILPSHWKRGVWRTAPAALIPPLFLALTYVVRPELRRDFDDAVLRTEFISYIGSYFAAWVIILFAGNITWDLRRQVRENQLIGRYRLIELVGKGGMGEVWRAFHPTLKTEVALKLTTHTGENELARFQREIEALTAITHPGVVKIFDCGITDEGFVFYTMELLQGRTLRERMDQQPPLTLVEIGTIIQQVASALQEAHTHGIVHRDIKPDNILLVPLPAGAGVQAKLIDFGIAKQQSLSSSSSTLTETGSVLGTPVFLAPEQALGEAVDGRTDVYALGAVLFACLTGRPPFVEHTLTAMLLAHAQKAPPPPSLFVSGLPTGTDEVVLRCLQKKPEQRYASAKDMGDAVAAVLTSPEAVRARLSWPGSPASQQTTLDTPSV